MLSPVLAGEMAFDKIITHDAGWYAKNGITCRFDEPEFGLLTGVLILVPLALVDKRPGVTVSGMLRNWGLVFVGNFAGAFTVALKKAVHPSPHLRYAALSESTTDLRKPNAAFRANAPLAERNPVAFWKGVPTMLFLITVFFIFLLNG